MRGAPKGLHGLVRDYLTVRSHPVEPGTHLSFLWTTTKGEVAEFNIRLIWEFERYG